MWAGGVDRVGDRPGDAGEGVGQGRGSLRCGDTMDGSMSVAEQWRERVEREGVVLEIVATEVGGAWELAIENSHGGRSVWSDFFDDFEQALAEGHATLAREGVQEFTRVPDLEALRHLPWEVPGRPRD